MMQLLCPLTHALHPAAPAALRCAEVEKEIAERSRKEGLGRLGKKVRGLCGESLRVVVRGPVGDEERNSEGIS